MLALLPFGEHHGVGTEAVLEPRKGPADQWGFRVRSVFPKGKNGVCCVLARNAVDRLGNSGRRATCGINR